MGKNKEIWMDSVLRSMEGNTRVKPRADLFDQIEQRIEKQQINRIQSTVSWRNIAAVGVILIAVNSYFITQMSSSKDTTFELAYSEESGSDYSLVSNLKLYE